MEKYKRSQVEVTCNYCKELFNKDKSEVSRNERLGKNNYCSRSCCGKATIGNIKERSDYDISKHANNRKDGYSGIREFLRRIKSRAHESDLTLQSLKELWDKQNICPYSGVQLSLPTGSGKHSHLTTASLDRIDSSRGSMLDNVQFVSSAINYMKNNMSHEDTVILCNNIAAHWS